MSKIPLLSRDVLSGSINHFFFHAVDKLASMYATKKIWRLFVTPAIACYLCFAATVRRTYVLCRQ